MKFFKIALVIVSLLICCGIGFSLGVRYSAIVWGKANATQSLVFQQMIHETLSDPILICGEPSSERIIEAQNVKIDKATSIASQALNSSIQSIINTDKNWFFAFKALNPKVFFQDQHIYDSDLAAASEYIKSKEISTSSETRSFVNLLSVKKAEQDAAANP